MNILVTGSNGFIGNHVCKWLKDHDCYVVGLGRREVPVNCVDDYICCDLSDEKATDLLRERKGPDFDAVVHLAADMRKEPYTTDVLFHNCVGTQRLLEFCEHTQIPVFVQLSSLPVIGHPVENPITESHPLAPPTVYHVTKRTQELLADYAWYTHGLRTVSFRISSPVGIGSNPKTILPVFVKNAIAGDDLVLYGKGTRQQNYVHVYDIAQAIYKAILTDAQGVYNLGSHNLISNRDLAQKCIDITQSSSQIIYADKEDPMDTYIWNVSLEKTRKDIGYQPQYDIEDAIREIYEYEKNNSENQ